MAFTDLIAPDVGDPTKRELIASMIANESDLNDRLEDIGEVGVLNGSFEHGAINDEPNQWTITKVGAETEVFCDENEDYTHHGKQNLVINTEINTNTATITSTGYTACRPGQTIGVGCVLTGSSGTGQTVTVSLLWYHYDIVNDTWVAAGTASTTLRAETYLQGLEDRRREYWTAEVPMDAAGTQATFYRLRFYLQNTANAVRQCRIDNVTTGPVHGRFPIDHNDAGNPVFSGQVDSLGPYEVDIPTAALAGGGDKSFRGAWLDLLITSDSTEFNGGSGTFAMGQYSTAPMSNSDLSFRATFFNLDDSTSAESTIWDEFGKAKRIMAYCKTDRFGRFFVGTLTDSGHFDLDISVLALDLVG